MADENEAKIESNNNLHFVSKKSKSLERIKISGKKLIYV